MSNEFFMGGPMPNGYAPTGYTGAGYAPSYLSTQLPRMNTANTTNIVWTMGLESAKAYPLLPGRTLMLMDSESPRFFIKSVDNNGYATLKAYAFQEEPTSTPKPAEPEYVTKEQLDAALAAVHELLRQNTSPAADNGETTTTKVEMEVEKTRTKNLL